MYNRDTANIINIVNMNTKKIQKTVEVVVNLGNYQSARFTSGLEQEVTFDSEKELQEKEMKIWSNLSRDLKLGMWKSFEEMAAHQDAPAKFADACRQRIEVTNVRAKQDAAKEESQPKSTEVK